MSNINEEKNCSVGPFSRKLTCDKCGSCVCERVYIINLALSYIDKQYCIKCLAEEKDIEETMVFENLYEYIKTRPCFQTDWEKINPKECPKYPACFCGELNEQK